MGGGVDATLSLRQRGDEVVTVPLSHLSAGLLEGSRPWRTFRAHRGQRHYSGFYQLAAGGATLDAIATDAGTTIDHIRLLLGRQPTPDTGTRPRRCSGSRNRARRRLRGDVDTIIANYTTERQSIRRIARAHGVPRGVVSEVLHEADTTPRPGRPPAPISRQWLYQQYVHQRRTLPDLARELGMSPVNLARYARRLQVPLRSRGGSSHAANQALLRNPPILNPRRS